MRENAKKKKNPKEQKTRIAKTILQRRTHLENFYHLTSTHFKSAIIKIVSCWCKDRHRYQWKKREHPGADAHTLHSCPPKYKIT